MPTGLLEYLGSELRLGARNRLALLYSYLIPVTFFVSFLIIYRHEEPLLLRHMGELLAISALGGACFSLPTSMVAERERGVWRQYRLSPVPTGTLAAGALIARYVHVLGAGIVLLALAMIAGRWIPSHPLQLWLAFSCASFALLGLGLVLAAVGDTVQAVQALGQCIFLPMLILGGVAGRLSNPPEWVSVVTAFLPGRYAVEAIQECLTGAGLGALRFHLVALVAIGASGCVAGAKLFRWDSQRRFRSSQNRSWVLFALGSWLVVGTAAIQRGALVPRRAITAPISALAGPSAPAPVSAKPAEPTKSEPWRTMTAFNFAALPIADIPPDDGNISPLAAEGESAAGTSLALLEHIKGELPAWAPGHISDSVQRVRNYLYILGSADFAQSTIERYLPQAVLEHMLKEFPKDDLAQLMCWIALHPDEGDTAVLSDPLLNELNAANLDPVEVRTRVYYYSVKLTRWVVGF